MSALDLMRYNDDMENYGFIATCATLIHVTRLASLFALVYDIAIKCNWKNPRNGREINLKTLFIYSMICILEIVYCFLGKTDSYLLFLTLLSATASLIMMIAIAIDVLHTNDPDNKNTYTSWIKLSPYIGLSVVFTYAFSFTGNNIIIIFNSWLNTLALVPQILKMFKMKHLKIRVWLFVTGMIVYTCFMVGASAYLHHESGLKSANQAVYFGLAYLFIASSVCAGAYYRNVVLSGDSDNQTIEESQNSGDEIPLKDISSNVASQQEQREAAIIAGGSDDNSDGLNSENDDVTETTGLIYTQAEIVGEPSPRKAIIDNPAGATKGSEHQAESDEGNDDVSETKKMIDPQPKVAGEQSVSNSTNASAGATKEIKQAELNEENCDGTETTKMIDPQLEVAGVQSNSKATNSGAGAADDNKEAGRNEDNQGIAEAKIQ